MRVCVVAVTLALTQNSLGISRSLSYFSFIFFSITALPLTLTFFCYSSKTMQTIFATIRTHLSVLLCIILPSNFSISPKSVILNSPPTSPFLSLHLFLPLYQTVLPLPFACQLPWQLKSPAHSCRVTNDSLNWDLKTK